MESHSGSQVWNASLLGLSLIFLALLVDILKHRRRGAGSPPGPTPLPIVGNLFLLDINNLPNSLSKLRKKYGNVFSLQMFWDKMVVVNGYEAVKEALVTKSEDTADRPSIPMFEHLGFHKGIAFSGYGQHWKDMRRFALTTLRNFGMGKKSIEERVREEAEYLCAALQDNEGRSFDPYILLHNSVSNVIFSIIFGDRFDYSDEKFQRMILLSKEVFELETGLVPQMLNIFPWLIKIPGPHKKLFKAQSLCLDFLRAIIKEHKDTWEPAIRRDFIDAFLEEIEKVRGSKVSVTGQAFNPLAPIGDFCRTPDPLAFIIRRMGYPESTLTMGRNDPRSNFTETTLLFTTADLFAAGTETTATTLQWSLLYMLLHPQIQRQVHEEIDKVIGHDRIPTMEDQANMPFTNAVIHETQRCGNILPMSLFHMAYTDTTIQGYTIPKGTTIVPNLMSVLKNENIWEKPYQFFPEHFLDAEGHFVKREAFIPFSAGRRVCVGEQLARMDLFIFFTSLLQRFDFQIPCDQPRPRDDPVFLFSYSPRPFQICAKLR